MTVPLVGLYGYAPRAVDAFHHIVVKNAHRADEARDILLRYEIEIDAAVNRVLLPASRASTTPGAYDPSMHTNVYYDRVNQMLRDAAASGKDAVIATLQLIRDLIQKDQFTPNKKP